MEYKLHFENALNDKLNLYRELTTDTLMEDVIRDIIQIMLREPLVKAVLEDELNKISLLNYATLSEVRIDKECNIFLTHYDNTLIDIKGHQPKALYLFYLFSSKSVSNRDLPAHKETLKKIYQIVSGKDEYQCKLNIEGFLGRKGGISDITHKINTALKETIPQESLKYYMIKGSKNCARQVLIPKHLIKIENEWLLKISKSKK